MAVKKALVIEGVYLHTEDAPGLDDIQVYVSGETVDITTHHKNTISLDFEELDAINALVAEAVRESEQRAVEGARNSTHTWPPDWSKIPEAIKFIAKDSDGKVYGFVKRPRAFGLAGNGFWWNDPATTNTKLLNVTIPGDWQTSLHERPVVVAPTWSPDWSKIPVGFDHAAVDADGRAWAYPQMPKTLSAMWATHFLGNAHSIGYVVLPAGMTWTNSYCKRPLVIDDLAFLGMTWADVPEMYNFVAVDEDGKVYSFTSRPEPGILLPGIWMHDKPMGFRKLIQITLPPNLDWRNTLFVRPGYTESQS